MIALLLSLALAAEAAAAPPPPAKSAIETMDAKIKAERIEAVQDKITKLENVLKGHTDLSIANTRKINPKAAAAKEAERERLRVEIPRLKIELGWLKGEITPAGTEKAAADAQAAMDKAKEAKQPTEELEKALAVAVTERDEVARLEAAEKPKTPEPEEQAAR